MHPNRATIFDRSGKQFLAMNKDCFSLFILPKTIKSAETLLPFLQKYFPQAVDRLQKNKDKHFMFVQRKLTDNQIKSKPQRLASLDALRGFTMFWIVGGMKGRIGKCYSHRREPLRCRFPAL